MHVPSVAIGWNDDTLTVTADRYVFAWDRHEDEMVLTDPAGRTIVAGPMQPAIVLSGRQSAPGVPREPTVAGDTVTFAYRHVNGTGYSTVVWRFAPEALWLEPVRYEDPVAADVVSLLSFAAWDDGHAQPGLKCAYLVHPGASESSALGPIIPTTARLDATTWLGRGSNDTTEVLAQQWGLPIHYFGGFTIRGSMVERHALTREVSDAFCCGLTAIPSGDLMLRHRGQRVSPLLQVRSDMWGHLRTGQGPLDLGAGWVWTFGRDYRAAIRSYYREILAAGIVTPPARSAHQNEVLALSQFNTWGAQCAAGVALTKFSQPALETIFEEMWASGLRPGMFVIDDKWEGEYGLLTHDRERFPEFDEFLDRVRSTGMKIGLWAAFLRCDDPASHGLTTSHMLCDPHGRPVTRGNHGHEYYLFDVSQEPVRQVLARRAREFVTRYRPDLVKFDFGYELPAMAFAAPHRRDWGGEILLIRALELVIGAMRSVNPDLVVMYYNLSPLLAEHIDLHAIDDMYLCADEYHAEANRRIFFSSLLGEVGVATYGSGGYDWLRMRDIWFDTVASGPLGSLGSFRGDPRDSAPTLGDIARYNGLAALTRPTHHFDLELRGENLLGGSLGARAGSWIRREGPQQEITLVALRTTSIDGTQIEANVPGVLAADGDIVAAALDNASIVGSHRLGIVACTPDDRPVALRLVGRGTRQQAQARAHRHGGRIDPVPTRIDNSDLVLVIDPDSAAAEPVEWVEVTFTAVSSPLGT